MKSYIVYPVPLLLPGFADAVIPSDRVTRRVIVREGATRNSPAIGGLRPGDHLEYLGSVPGWHRVRLSNGTRGYVSKAWTRVIPAEGNLEAATVAAGDFNIDVVDVGTGLAILVRGNDFALIYDGGSNDDRKLGNSNRLLAFVRAAAPSLTAISHMILSHPHRDHVELLADLFTEYEIRHVWDSGAVNPICGYRAFLSAVRDEPGATYPSGRFAFGTHQISFAEMECSGHVLPEEVMDIVHGSRIDHNQIPLGKNASMTFLYIDGSDHGTRFNENTLVLRLDLGQRRVLLMGDAEAGGRSLPSTLPALSSIEGTLLQCCASELRADVLVVGHHGSMTSSRTVLLDAVGASIFVLASGPFQYNGVVLPDQEVIDELESRGQLFRTDFDDLACLHNSAKIGPDDDDEAGGCDNVRIQVRAGSGIDVNYWRTSD